MFGVFLAPGEVVWYLAGIQENEKNLRFVDLEKNKFNTPL